MNAISSGNGQDVARSVRPARRPAAARAAAAGRAGARPARRTATPVATVEERKPDLATRVVETLVGGVTVGLLLARPRWGLRLLGAVAARHRLLGRPF